ncbi:hypothetical protein BDR26DRAFT_840005 [Obelidium mucronatum]|nr:hypothetical protein BDR26DRAFT_840005 [Obelidium mucronatum]
MTYSRLSLASPGYAVLMFGGFCPITHPVLETQLSRFITWKPVKINVHGGCDYRSLEETAQYFDDAVTKNPCNTLMWKYSMKPQNPGSYINPWITQKVLSNFPIMITADLSHRCCCEVDVRIGKRFSKRGYAGVGSVYDSCDSVRSFTQSLLRKKFGLWCVDSRIGCFSGEIILIEHIRFHIEEEEDKEGNKTKFAKVDVDRPSPVEIGNYPFDKR